jgi:hypothetical protein
MPADILIAPTGPAAGGLDVTIAAATPDLRDRLSAATAELQAELSAIGAEVDAIRVELRADLAEGGSGADQRGGPAGESASGPASRGGADAAAQMGWADQGAGPGPDSSPDRERQPDDGGDVFRESTDSAGRGGGAAGDQGAGQAARDVERLRLRLDRAAGPGLRLQGGVEGRQVPSGWPHRIDRYA